ncbi:hypothetical protein BGZ81_000367 [Podila clonocystis]|nr:hypothetical protein BGZ81_000367 [Podila clonocystis]
MENFAVRRAEGTTGKVVYKRCSFKQPQGKIWNQCNLVYMLCGHTIDNIRNLAAELSRAQLTSRPPPSPWPPPPPSPKVFQFAVYVEAETATGALDKRKWACDGCCCNTSRGDLACYGSNVHQYSPSGDCCNFGYRNSCAHCARSTVNC